MSFDLEICIVVFISVGSAAVYKFYCYFKIDVKCLFFFFVWCGIHLLSGSDADCGGIKPASNIVIQNGETSHSLRCLMYGAR